MALDARVVESIKFHVETLLGPVLLLTTLLAAVYMASQSLVSLTTVIWAIAACVAACVVVWAALHKLPGLQKRDACISRDTGYTGKYRHGEQLVMGFRRQSFVWSDDHIPGTELRTWELRTDVAGDAAFRLGMCPIEFESVMTKAVSMPDWIDSDLLDEGCRFFRQLWPFVFYSFSWAMVGGFGSESASAVLLQSRYWASQGPTGRRDTWDRLRETACWLYDMGAHGRAGFKPGGVAWRACLHVRYLHCRTRATIRKTGDWDTDKFGEPINQAQLIGTLLGSSLLLMQGIEELAGVSLPQRKKESFLHLWRVIGFLFGVDDDINPNRSCQHATLVMESLFSFGIEGNPDPKLAKVLTEHIIHSVSDGAKQDFNAPTSPGLVSMSAWLFLGKSYGAAIGLPEASRSEWVFGMLRAVSLKIVLCVYLCVPGASMLFEWLFGYLWNVMVKSIRKDQPNCRFGAIPDCCPAGKKQSDSTAEIDSKWQGG